MFPYYRYPPPFRPRVYPPPFWFYPPYWGLPPAPPFWPPPFPIIL
ncbi:hypothetical protein [Alkalihalobacterium bogoriense]|nr:hypothetical protein [Alkalihalobacterium bogoriense]